MAVSQEASVILIVEVILQDKNRFGGKIGIFPNHFWQSFEIDEPDDWNFVELVFNEYLIEDYKDLGVDK